MGLIVPISIFGTDGFKALQQIAIKGLSPLWVSSFANRPSQLFDGAQKRLTILTGKRLKAKTPTIFTSKYYRWTKEEFKHLFGGRVEYAPTHQNFTIFPNSLEKLGNSIEISAFMRITCIRDRIANAVSASANGCIYYTRKFGYFLAFLNSVPRITEIKSGRRVPPSELKELSFRSSSSVLIGIAALTSSTFFWFWNVLSDCRNLNRRDLLAFTVNPEALPSYLKRDLLKLSVHYLNELKKISRKMLKSGLRIETFEYSACKPIIDQIDQVLAKHYGFTDEELDFIINYDIKYRMGKGANSGEET
ncbi:MAG: hypothetical protein JW902_19065 [Syntrophaceae bacterium]|nr:hypothetical protein [Syntrophaceae bacterium]